MPNHAPLSTVQQFNRCQSMPQHPSKQSHCTNFTGTSNVWLTTQTQLKHLPNHAPTPGQWTDLRTFAKTDSNVHRNPHYWNSRSRLGLTHCTDFAVTTGFEFFLIWGGELCWWFPTSTARWQFPGCLSDGMNRLYPISGGCQILRQYAVFMNVGRLPKCGVNPVHGNIWRQENNQCTTTKRLSSVFHRIILGVFLFQVDNQRQNLCRTW